MKLEKQLEGEIFGKNRRMELNNDLFGAYRRIGNDCYKNLNFVEALKCYNRCLTIGGDISLIYFNRSAVYLELKQYQLCLDNIKLAREAAYQSWEKLISREVKCKQLMESDEKEVSDPWDFFKLSYPANNKIPFIVNCVEIAQDEKFGRKIVTTRDLKPGDIIAIEEPAIKCQAETKQCCRYCFRRNNFSLIPNELSHLSEQELYCSIECKEKATKIFRLESNCEIDDVHRTFYEALNLCNGSFETMEQILDDPDLRSKTVFDFDWRNDVDESQVKYQTLVVINGLATSSKDSKKKLRGHKFLKTIDDEDHKRIAQKLMRRLKRITTLNAIGVDQHAFDAENLENKLDLFEARSTGWGVLLFGSLFNHSCDQNINRMAVENKIVFYANRPIAKDQQLFVNYGPFFAANSKDDRQKFLRESYGFICDCRACSNDFPLLYTSQLVTIRQSIADLVNVKDKKIKLKENCDKLMSLQLDSESEEIRFEMLKLIFENIFLLTSFNGNIFANHFHYEGVRQYFADDDK